MQLRAQLRPSGGRVLPIASLPFTRFRSEEGEWMFVSVASPAPQLHPTSRGPLNPLFTGRNRRFYSPNAYGCYAAGGIVLGFETIGNATVIAYDGEPVLATDPWVEGDPYFGSWGHSHAIPVAQREAIARSKFVWFSHAHPDHINIESLTNLAGKQILLADHRGKRIENDLRGMGFNVRLLPNREWTQLSPRVKVFTMSDANQDSILLIDVGGRLIINLNDGSPKLGERVIRPIAREYAHSYLLRLWGYGDADMINMFSEAGERILPVRDRRPGVLAQWVSSDAVRFKARYAIPFSSFHRYQRSDSIWANPFRTPLEDFYQWSDPSQPAILPAFLQVNCETGEHMALEPPAMDDVVRAPEDFGDHWGDRLEKDQKVALRAYFQRKESLYDRFGFLRFRVGGEETTVDLNPRLRDIGITFEAPRQSLMTAVEYRVFDDLMIGNFMKTTLHGSAKLYPGFTP
jgi:hypothetical protein